MNSIIESDIPQYLQVGNWVHIGRDCTIGEGTRICDHVNMYGCEIGKDCMIGTYVELQENVKIGNNTRVQSHTFICSNVEIGNDCFVAHSVVFVNDTFSDGCVHFDSSDWGKTVIGNNVKIGSNATILPCSIGDNAVIGAGAIVTKDVGEGEVIINVNKRLK